MVISKGATPRKILIRDVLAESFPLKLRHPVDISYQMENTNIIDSGGTEVSNRRKYHPKISFKFSLNGLSLADLLLLRDFYNRTTKESKAFLLKNPVNNTMSHKIQKSGNIYAQGQTVEDDRGIYNLMKVWHQPTSGGLVNSYYQRCLYATDMVLYRPDGTRFTGNTFYTPCTGEMFNVFEPLLVSANLVEVVYWSDTFDLNSEIKANGRVYDVANIELVSCQIHFDSFYR